MKWLFATACAIALPCAAFDSKDDQKLQNSIHMNAQALAACEISSDCMLIPPLSGCCKNDAINRKYLQAVDSKRNALWQALTPENAKGCSAVECQVRPSRAVCEQHQCRVAPLIYPAGLTEKQVRKLADGVMAKQGLAVGDFAAPAEKYDDSYRYWRVEYGPRINTHDENMRKTGRDTIYNVIVNDTTGVATIDTGTFIMDPNRKDPNCTISWLCR